ncbi:DUF4364 family protein [Acidaminobacterium chupaoyuni]
MNPGYLREKPEIKYFILYAMNELPFPISEPDLLDLCLIDEAFGYFEFSEAFAELLKTGHVQQERSEQGDVTYHITPKGRSAAEIFEGDLRKSVRDKAQAAVIRVVRKIRRNSSIKTVTTENGDGTFNVHLCITDQDSPVMALDVMVMNKRQSTLLEENFKQSAETIYEQILQILLSDTFRQD